MEGGEGGEEADLRGAEEVPPAVALQRPEIPRAAVAVADVEGGEIPGGERVEGGEGGEEADLRGAEEVPPAVALQRPEIPSRLSRLRRLGSGRKFRRLDACWEGTGRASLSGRRYVTLSRRVVSS